MRGIVVLAVLPFVLQAPTATAGASQCGDSSGGLSDRGVQTEATTAPCPVDGDPASQRALYDIRRDVSIEPELCPTTPDARLETFYYYLPGTRTQARDPFTRCVGANIPEPRLPPPPPAAIEVFNTAPLPMPEVHLNPRVRGLVGLETWLWWGADTAMAPLTAQAGEWGATVEAHVSELRWDLGNGDVRTADSAGTSETDPSLTYVYEHQCDCTVTLTVAWSGTVTLTHPLAPVPIVQQVGPVTFSESRAYPVEEREAVIVG